MSKESRIEQSHPIAIIFAFRPNFTDTTAMVTLVTGTGDRCRRLILWRDHLPSNRHSLAGLDSRQCAILLGDELHTRWLVQLADEATARDAVGGVSGAPVGATGATVTNVPLPGL